MVAYRQVVTCGLTAKRPGSAPSPTVVNWVWHYFTLFTYCRLQPHVSCFYDSKKSCGNREESMRIWTMTCTSGLKLLVTRSIATKDLFTPSSLFIRSFYRYVLLFCLVNLSLILLGYVFCKLWMSTDGCRQAKMSDALHKQLSCFALWYKKHES